MRTAGATGSRETPESVQHLASFYNVLIDNPGLTAYQVARKLGKPVAIVYSWLPSIEYVGLFLYEDDDGKLYIYE